MARNSQASAAFIFLTLSVPLLCGGAWGALRLKHFGEWPKATARIVRVDRHIRGKTIWARYVPPGAHRAIDVRIDGVDSQPGDLVEVALDPRDPRQAVTRSGALLAVGFMGGLGIAFAAGSVLALALEARRVRGRQTRIELGPLSE